MSEALAREGDIAANSAWSVDTLRDYFLGLLLEKDRRLNDLITANDRRYSQEVAHLQKQFDGSDKAVSVAFTAQQRAIDTAFTAQQTGLNAALLAQKEAIATALVAAEKAVNAALVSSAQAVQKAEAAAERRFEGVNEFRQTLSDQQRTLIPRAEVDVLMKSVNDKVDLLSNAYRAHQAEGVGKVSGWAAAVGVVGFIAVILSVAAFLMKFKG